MTLRSLSRSRHSRPASRMKRIGACLITLSLLSIIFGKLWVADASESGGESSSEPTGKIVGTLDGNPQLTLSGHEDKLTNFRISLVVKVTLNGVPVPFSTLKN